MLKFKTLVAVLAGMLVLLPSLSAAQTTDGLKIGVVNVNLLLQESPQAREATKQLEDEFAPRRREIVAMQTELEEKAAEIQKNLEVMSVEERENAQRELRNDERSLLRAQNEFREDVDLRRNEAIGQVQNEVLREIQAYGEEAGFDLILVEGIVYASERIDVTREVLERLEAGFGAEG